MCLTSYQTLLLTSLLVGTYKYVYVSWNKSVSIQLSYPFDPGVLPLIKLVAAVSLRPEETCIVSVRHFYTSQSLEKDPTCHHG